jgi:predicted O-methyltransferase YrrM
MTQELWSAVDRYLCDQFVRPDTALEGALAACEAAGLPAIQVSPNQGKLLMLLATVQRAKRILEIGTLGGYSTIWLAKALPSDGRLVTLEIDPAYAALARANIARAGFDRIVDVRVGAAVETLAQLAAEKCDPFDMIFIDADKPSYAEYLAWSLKLARPGTLVIADNVVRKGAVIDPASEDESVQGVRRFNELLAAEPRVTATAIQTVGSKGHDGFAVAVVNATSS